MKQPKSIVIVTILFILCLVNTNSWAQYGYYEDVSRLSVDVPVGTARTSGFGGASQAIGADFSNLATNPAGLAWFQHNELILSPKLTSVTSDATYMGKTKQDNRTEVNLANLGVVFCSNTPPNSTSIVKGLAFGLGLNRQADFLSNVSWSGLSSGIGTDADGRTIPIRNGLVHNYLLLANNNRIGSNILKAAELYPDQQQIRSAYGVYMLDTTSLGGNFTTFLPPADYAQNMTINNRGSRFTIDIGGGINLADRVSFGISAGIGIISYTSSRTYTETFDKIYYDAQNPISNDQTYLGSSYKLEDEVTTQGSSFNCRLGMQAIVSPTVRIGVSAQLPSVYGIYQGYETTLSARYNNTIQTITRGGIQSTINLPTGPFRGPITVPDIYYVITTPWKLSGGIALMNKKLGLISADLDYIDYSSASIRSSDFNTEGDNRAIGIVYRKAINVRIGSEFKYGAWRYRAGFAEVGNPIAKDIDLGSFFSKGSQIYSLGVGYRGPVWVFDFALSYNQNQQRFTAHAYTLPAEVRQYIVNFQSTVLYLF